MTYLRFLWFQLWILFTRYGDVAWYVILGGWLQGVLLIPVTLVRHSTWAAWVRFGPRAELPPETPPLLVILLSYKRPVNIEWLVRSFLQCDFVGRVVVSNNNPEVDLERMAPILGDPRVELIRQPVATKQGVRFTLAADRAEQFGHFVSPDDDCFLYPHQIQQLYAELLAAPEVPHGIAGEVRRKVTDFGTYPFDVGVRGEREVDHLTDYYLFTGEQVLATLEIYRQMGWDDPRRLGNGEDIALSFSGRGRPRVHEIGRRLRCNSAWAANIATWSTHQNFFAERAVIHGKMRRLRPRPVAA